MHSKEKRPMQEQPSSLPRLLEGLQNIVDKQHKKVHSESIEMIQANVNDAAVSYTHLTLPTKA